MTADGNPHFLDTAVKPLHLRPSEPSHLPFLITKLRYECGSERKVRMTLYIMKNGQRLGPYTLAEAQALVTAGTVLTTDWAWYEGLSKWIPLFQIPGFVSSGSGAFPLTAIPGERPPLVWIISIFTIGYSGFRLFSMIWMWANFLKSTQAQDAQRDAFHSMGYMSFGIALLIIFAQMVGAVLLLLLKRSALSLYAGAFVISLIWAGYNIVITRGSILLHLEFDLRLALAWGINLAIIFYIWHLCKKGVLR